MRGFLFPLILVCLFAASIFGQRINEDDSVVSVSENEVVVRLAVDSDAARSDVPAAVEMIDAADTSIASETKSGVNLQAGRNVVEFRVSLSKTNLKVDEDIAWMRLRYRLGETRGTASFSHLIHDLFELKIVGVNDIFSGTTYRAQVTAINPLTGKPSPGVQLDAVLSLDLKGDEESLRRTASGTTDAEGVASFEFDIPPETNLGDDGQFKVVGRRNNLVREVENDLRVASGDTRIIMLADKPIYQPGQVLNLRGILLKGGQAETVLPLAEVEFRVKDENGTLLFREKVVGSEYGIVATSWQIPANARLGQYRIEVRDKDAEMIGIHYAKVSRYDLPNFAVTAKPSKSFYLPTDKEAEVEVRADYLFGKPVLRGKVRVVEENSREWNWEEQKYDIEEGEVSEGETDSDGKFIARFDLKKKHDEIKDDEWRKYQDVKFAAYFTDATTNKTEQRFFTIRVTREPIHVYMIRGYREQSATLELVSYVSTFYADGTPAECDVEIKASLAEEGKFKTVTHVRTNAFGAGKVVMPRPVIGDPDDDLDFRLLARDKSGRLGTQTLDVTFSSGGAIGVSTPRAILKPGEPIEIEINSSLKSGLIYVDIVRSYSVIESRSTKLENGRAVVSIPYGDKFRGEMVVAAYMEDPSDRTDVIVGTTGVMYPAREGITVDAEFDKTQYKPNDDATIRFGVRDAAGNAVPSALGLVVFDRAVEERALTDSDAGGMYRNLSGWSGHSSSSFGATSLKDLNAIDLTKPISPEVQLVAEIILFREAYYFPDISRSNSYSDEAASVFKDRITKQFEPIAGALTATYEKQDYHHPVDDASLRQILSSASITFDAERDPWDVGYRAKFSVNKERDILNVESAGPDKRFDTADDFVAFATGWNYFTATGKILNAALSRYYARTGNFIRDEKTLFAEADIHELRDRFGRPYRLTVVGEGRFIYLNLISAGPDGRFSAAKRYSADDFSIWSNRSDFFGPIEKKITTIQSQLKDPPANEVEFRAALKTGGIDIDKVRDANGDPIYVTALRRHRYWDKISVETVQGTERRTTKPVTQEIAQFQIRGTGSDRKRGTRDDITFMELIHVISEQSITDAAPVSGEPRAFALNSGAIVGTVTDANGAVIPNATVTSTNPFTKETRTTQTDADGRYLIDNVPAGTYSVSAAFSGFKNSVIENVMVQAGITTLVDLLLQAGAATTVDVTASSDEVQTSATSQITSLPLTTRSSLSLLGINVVTRSGTDPGRITGRQTSTPRVREYFPETLYWQPEIITDAEGNAVVKFRMADNITTWKLYTIASTRSGKIGFTEKDVTAFQSFFVDLDPPKFLTTGDEIFLPTQVRNYTERKQSVNVTMSPASWLGSLNGDFQRVAVASGSSENATFGFKALKPVRDGEQRVTATGESDSDAIERTVTVRPDGREVAHSESLYVAGSGKLELDFSADMIEGTQIAQLKIYTNPMAHVVEAIEGLLKRPYGCAEQAISTTYPNVMIAKLAASGSGRISPELDRKARNNLQMGYDRLLGYQTQSGGFSYWGGKERADIALTAYAIRFLSDASDFISVDTGVIDRAEDWLTSQQRADGSWNTKFDWEQLEDGRRAKATTTYVTRALAMNARRVRANTSATSDEKRKSEDRSKLMAAALSSGLNHLRQRNAEIDDPYSLALFGLAALDAGDDASARSIARRLVGMEKSEGSGVYWNLESNTAFNGWGTAGRVETTALVVQLLKRLNIETELVEKSVVFLLQKKDRFGVWYSTQTTINVLDTLVMSLANNDRATRDQVVVSINGAPLQTIDIAADKVDEITVDLDGKLSATKNQIEVRSSNGSSFLAQLVSTHYVRWSNTDPNGRDLNESRALKLSYSCDRSEAAIAQEVSCTVGAERIGYQGYGMLLAEIGTPPGADVSRESLQAAMNADPSLASYDVLPDRIVLYLWSKPGGTKFNFKFRPRYGVKAKTPASVLYDYYNPEAQAVVAPLRFSVQ